MWGGCGTFKRGVARDRRETEELGIQLGRRGEGRERVLALKISAPHQGSPKHF